MRSRGPSPSPEQRDQYVTGYVEALRAGRLPEPSAEQCEDCANEADDEVFDDYVEPGPEHVLDHVLRNEYVPGLVVCALSSADASIETFQAINEVWGDADDDILYSSREDLWEQIRSALRAYLDEKLG